MRSARRIGAPPTTTSRRSYNGLIATGSVDRPRLWIVAAENKEDRELDELLTMLKDTRGFDFTGYKRTTVMRRVKRRMSAMGVVSYGEYRDYLEVQPEEYSHLFDSLLINVTSFFRDPPAWDTLIEKVLPALIAARPPTAPIRVWSAGCSSGEEAYTLAIVLAEALGIVPFKARVKIYATDLDEDALREARTGLYDERRVRDVPHELQEKYFEAVDGKYTFRRDLRRQVIFGRNDLISDAPISRVDLLAIRNTLMYFNAETQANIVRRLHFALADEGHIFLGKAEMLMNHTEWFEPVDLRKRLFRKVASEAPNRGRRQVEDQTPEPGILAGQLKTAALAAGPVAQLALDLDGKLVVANSRAESLFGLHAMDLGRPFQDLEVSYRPVELRSIIKQAQSESRQIEMTGVVWHRTATSDPNVLDVTVTPLFSAANALIGMGVSFTDVTHYHRLHAELEHANEELESAYQELQSLNEELETTNEELQSTNEELETTNEELQSTNEELETMNEELQSTNDELQEINDALRTRTEELNSTNAFLASVLQSLGTAVMVIDDELRITVWSAGAEELWGVRGEEARGRHLLALDIGLPVKDVAPLAQRMLRKGADAKTTTVIDAINRRGKPVRLRIDSSVLLEEREISGVILVANFADDPTEISQS
jgi:two-component system CheB/CheR fusion protein